MKKWTPLILLFLAVGIGLFGYLRSFTVTNVSNMPLYVTPEDSAGWHITSLQEGKEKKITSAEALSTYDTVLLRRTVTEDWLNYETIEVDGHRPVCVWVDNKLVFSNASINLKSPGELPKAVQPEGQAFTMVFSMNPSWVGKTITVGSSLFTDELFGSIYFNLASSNTILAQASADAATKLLPGTAYAVLFLLLFGLFLFRSTIGKGALPLLYLASSALVQMLCYFGNVEGNPLVFPYFDTARILCILLPLLYLSTRMIRSRKLFLWLVIPLWLTYFVTTVAWSVFQVSMPIWFDKLAYINVFLLLWLLICVVREYREGNTYFKHFLGLSGIALVGYGMLFPVAYLWDKTAFEWLLIYWQEALAGYPLPMAFCIFTTILIILFVLSIWDLVESRAQATKEMKALKLRSEITAQSLSSVQQSNEMLARVRHDELHHLRTLAALYNEDDKKAAEYITSLTQELKSIPSMRFTENRLINAILSVQSNEAFTRKVRFEAKAILPELLPIPETELSTVLMNLISNAIEAATKAPEGKDCLVSVLLKVEDNTLLVTISNTLPTDFDYEGFRKQIFVTTKDEASCHGYGIPSARSVATRYGGELRYSIKDDIITVNTVLQF